jgi:predicted DNA-binding transcriptional regulator YafY
MRVQHEADAQLPRLRRAISDESWVRLQYVDAQGADTERVVVPLALYFWGQRWLLASYCWLRNAYRSFRVDRIHACFDVDPDPSRVSAVEQPISLPGYIAAMEAQYRADMAKAGRPVPSSEAS